jgi:hypothetical protein
MNNILDYIVGICSIFIIIYRITRLMIPMIKQAIITKDIHKIFSALSLLI